MAIKLTTLNEIERDDEKYVDKYVAGVWEICANGECEVCDKTGLVLDCETSGGEYQSKQICFDCITFAFTSVREAAEPDAPIS